VTASAASRVGKDGKTLERRDSCFSGAGDGGEEYPSVASFEGYSDEAIHGDTAKF